MKAKQKSGKSGPKQQEQNEAKKATWAAQHATKTRWETSGPLASEEKKAGSKSGTLYRN